MFKRISLLTLLGSLILCLAGCGGEQPAAPTDQAAPAPAKKEEPPVETYDITKVSLTDHPDWSSRNVAILGAKIGDVTNKVLENLGKAENNRTLPEDYLTIHQNSGLFVYTQKMNGKIRKIEVYDTFAKQIVDENLKKLLMTGDLKFMREAFGPEEKTEENMEDPTSPGTEYAYDAKGFRFVQFKLGNRKLNALRFTEIKKGTT